MAVLSDANTRVYESTAQQIEAGEYYNAHQKLRTTATRLMVARGANRPSDEKFEQGTEMLTRGSLLLLQKGQVGSGVDLALFLVSQAQARHVAYTGESAQYVQNVLSLAGPANQWRKSLADAALAWSKTPERPGGDARIHAHLGFLLHKEGTYDQAAQQLILACDVDSARLLADTLYAWSANDSIVNAGKYAAYGVFALLSLHAVGPARAFLGDFMSKFVGAHPEIVTGSETLARRSYTVTVTKLASLNFVQLLLPTVQSANAADSYKSLVAHYEGEIPWLKTPSGQEALRFVGYTYFHIEPPKTAANPMMDLLSGLMSGK